MANSLTCLAPAKINLTLEITGRRGDGYHTLKSVMQSISLCDIVKTSINKNGCISLSCSDANVPSDSTNTAYMAANAFRQFTGLDFGADISIEKHIPMEAGLGGGSSDGAAVIKALDKLLETELDEKELLKICAETGADVPFCFIGGTALCEGIGEIITPLPPIEDCCIVLGKGNEGFSTKNAFTKLDKVKQLDYRFDASDFSGDIKSAASKCYNAFERVSINAETEFIRGIMRSNNALTAVLSGSGSAVYSIFKDISSAESCCFELDKKGFFASLCRPVNHGVIFPLYSVV